MIETFLGWAEIKNVGQSVECEGILGEGRCFDAVDVWPGLMVFF